MKEILKRFSSPVVIIQLISIVVGVVIVLAPNIAETVKLISGAVIAIINIYAGVNNPTDREQF
jgi:hypothetical protein